MQEDKRGEMEGNIDYYQTNNIVDINKVVDQGEMVAIFRKKDGHLLSKGTRRKKERKIASYYNEE